MSYVFSGIIVPGRPIAVPPKPQPIVTSPAQRLPVGLSVWWRPVAVGFPNTGTSASYVGPMPGAPQRYVGASNPSLIRPYFPQYKNARLFLEEATPSMATSFGAAVAKTKPTPTMSSICKTVLSQTLGELPTFIPGGTRVVRALRAYPTKAGAQLWPTTTQAVGGGDQVVATTAGLVRLPKGVWLNPLSPALMGR